MYFEMKSFWNPATRGGIASPAHSTTLLVSLLPAASATRTVIDEVGSFAGSASSPRRATRPRWYMYRLLAASPSTTLLPPIPASVPSAMMLLHATGRTRHGHPDRHRCPSRRRGRARPCLSPLALGRWVFST